jgi:hypothetical protein
LNPLLAAGTLQNAQGLFKRCIKGAYISVEPDHLIRYVDEEVFRFNQRKGKDGMRFVRIVASAPGKRLTYKRLIGEGRRRGG